MEKEDDLPKNLKKKIETKIKLLDSVAENIPGVIIIHNIRTSTVEYMSPLGLKQLNITPEELKELGAEYHKRFFNMEESEEYVPKIFDMVSNNDDRIVSYFQQVRPSLNSDYSWYYSNTKVFMHDDDGDPLLTITIANLVDPKSHVINKISRLLKEKNFLKINAERFNKLSQREKEVMKFTVLGYSASETASQLHISQNTVETHRRNLKKKLKTESLYDLSLYAQAFDLI